MVHFLLMVLPVPLEAAQSASALNEQVRQDRRGQRPRLEDVLEGTCGDERRVLFELALKLELELRREREEVPARAEYLARFPDEGDLLAQVVPHVPGYETW
jgi:hypothetical protein